MSIAMWAGFGQQWELNHKVDFDGPNRRIRIAPSVTELSVKDDLYSSWKEWVQLYDNAKFLPAFRSIGGDSVGGGLYAGDIYFLINNWQIEVDHNVKVTGTLYHDNNLEPFIVLPGGGVTSTVSNLAYALESATAGLTPEQQVQLDKILKAVKLSIALSA